MAVSDTNGSDESPGAFGDFHHRHAHCPVYTWTAMDVPQRVQWYGSPVHLGELFMVRKNNVEARCILRSHQLGWELCLQMGLNRDFLQTKVCRTEDEVLTTGEQWKAAMVTKGWS